MASDATSTEWYWDLQKQMAVPSAERGPGDQVLGPYRTKGEAENWQVTVNKRNEEWDDADEEWDGERDGDEQN